MFKKEIIITIIVAIIGTVIGGLILRKLNKKKDE